MTRTRIAIAVLAVLGLAALPSLHLEPIERLRRSSQQTDMRAKLDALPLPAESRLLAISEAPYPATTYFFASADREFDEFGTNSAAQTGSPAARRARLVLSGLDSLYL